MGTTENNAGVWTRFELLLCRKGRKNSLGHFWIQNQDELQPDPSLASAKDFTLFSLKWLKKRYSHSANSAAPPSSVERFVFSPALHVLCQVPTSSPFSSQF